MSLDNPILLIGLSVVAVLALAVLIIRRQRRQPAAPTPKAIKGKPRDKTARDKAARDKAAPPAAAPTLSDEDQRILESLGAGKARAGGAASPAAAPAPEAKVVSAMPQPTAPVSPTVPPTGGKIRILVADDNKDTRDNVSRLIAFEPDMQVVGQAFNGKQAVEMAVDLKPHIVLMDINMPDMDGIQATREMVVQAPFSQIIIMSVQFETDYMRAAMLAGARDYQTKPFSADELVNCIRRVYDIGRPIYQKTEQAERAARAKSEVAIASAAPQEQLAAPVFMVYSPKGGSGKTAVAINLAVALHDLITPVTLLDADLQLGDLPVDLNIRPKATLAELVAGGRPDPELLPSVMQPHSSGISVVFAPQKPEMMELITGNMMIQVARTLKSHTQALVVDTASYLTDHNLALLEVANDILLVITPDLPSVKDAKLFLELAPDLGVRFDRIALVINRATMPGAIPVAQIEKALKLTRVFQIPDDPKLRLSLIKGVSVFQLDANAPAALAFKQLAEAVWQHAMEPPAPVAAPLPVGQTPAGRS